MQAATLWVWIGGCAGLLPGPTDTSGHLQRSPNGCLSVVQGDRKHSAVLLAARESVGELTTFTSHLVMCVRIWRPLPNISARHRARKKFLICFKLLLSKTCTQDLLLKVGHVSRSWVGMCLCSSYLLHIHGIVNPDLLGCYMQSCAVEFLSSS